MRGTTADATSGTTDAVTDATTTAVATIDSTAIPRRTPLPNFDQTSTEQISPPPPPRAATAHHNPLPAAATRAPEVTSIVRGVVSSVRPFGVFVRPAGKARDGLVHCTQVSDELTFARARTRTTPR